MGSQEDGMNWCWGAVTCCHHSWAPRLVESVDISLLCPHLDQVCRTTAKLDCQVDVFNKVELKVPLALSIASLLLLGCQ